MKSYLYILLGQYLVFSFLVFYFHHLGSLSEYSGYFICGLVLIIIKDILTKMPYTQKSTHQRLKPLLLLSDLGKNISLEYFLLLLNRFYFFPTILCSYLMILLSSQIGYLEKLLPISEGTQNYLLYACIFSGICTVFQERQDEKYIEEFPSSLRDKLHIGLSVFLSLGGSFIVALQVEELGNIGYVISVLAGVIIFLVGISLLEDEGAEDNKSNTYREKITL